jgi:hypothetical protein
MRFGDSSDAGSLSLGSRTQSPQWRTTVRHTVAALKIGMIEARTRRPKPSELEAGDSADNADDSGRRRG